MTYPRVTYVGHALYWMCQGLLEGTGGKSRQAMRRQSPPLPPSGASTYVCTTVKRKPTPGKEAAPTKSAKEKESLVEWVLKNRAEMQLQKAAQAPAPPQGSMHLLPEDMIGLPRYLPLTFWAALLLGEHAPHYNTMLRWVRNGRIYPQPIKVGGVWSVRKDAAYMPD